jgi:hypothetical protein
MKTSTKTPDNALGSIDYDLLAIELVRALRGRRSPADFSRRIGYRSNVAHRWETRRSCPTAAVYLHLHRRITGAEEVFTRFFQSTPSWLETSARLPRDHSCHASTIEGPDASQRARDAKWIQSLSSIALA